MMYDLGAVVVPADLAKAVAAAEEAAGWLGGGVIGSEWLYVVTTATIGVSTKKSASSNRLQSHRCFHSGVGEVRDQLLRWVRVDSAFHREHRPFANLDRAALEATLGFDVPVGGTAICTIEPSDKFPKVRAFRLLSDESRTDIFPMSVTVLFRADPYKRLPQKMTAALAEKSALIVGVGSGGGEIAVQLASAGIGKLSLVDDDRIEPENLIRHCATRADLGRLKTRATATDIMERDLPTECDLHFGDIVAWADRFRRIVVDNAPDLLICATDSRVSRRLLNYISNRTAIPLLIAGLLDDGKIGEVLLTIPDRTACYECVRLELGAALEKPTSDERPDVPYSGGESTDLQSGAHRFDVAIVSGIATRMALEILAPDFFSELPMKYVVWGREVTSHPAPFTFDIPLSVNHVQVSRRSDCPICGDRRTEVSDASDTEIEAEYLKILADAYEI